MQYFKKLFLKHKLYIWLTSDSCLQIVSQHALIKRVTPPTDTASLDVRPDTGVILVDQCALITVRTENVSKIMDFVNFVNQVIGDGTVTKHVHRFVTNMYAFNPMVCVVKVASREDMGIYATKCVVQGVYAGHVIPKVEHAQRDVIKIGWELDVIVCIDSHE